jgi:uncharacterized membrane protein
LRLPILSASDCSLTALPQQEELMNSDIPGPIVRSGGHPILRILASFPIACFTCALLTDIAYVLTTNIMWADFSAWLLAAGMAGGVMAVIAGLASLVAGRRGRTTRSVWPIALGSLLVLAIAFFNNLVHSRDAWTSVMPLGLALSGVTVLVMLATVWLASSAVYRRGVATPYSGVSS